MRAVVALCVLLSGCAVPTAVHEAGLSGPEIARSFCFSRWQGATAAAATCAETCVEENLSNDCARKRCHGELASIKRWAEVESWCWDKHTPKLYHPTPEWPSASLKPIENAEDVK